MNSTFTAHLQVDGCDPDELEAQCDQVMDELIRLRVTDPAVAGTMASGAVEVSLTVTAESLPAAADRAMVILRTAIHAAEGHTPGWPRLDDRAVQSIHAKVAEAAPAGTQR